MQQLSGKDAALQIRAFSDVPIIMVTSMAQKATLAELREAGFTVLIKPFYPESVLEAATRALGV